MKESDILYENESHWVCKAQDGKEAYWVMRNELPYSVRCGIVSLSFGLKRAIKEADRRHNALRDVFCVSRPDDPGPLDPWC